MTGVFLLLGGIGLFLYGINFMSRSLEDAAGDNLRVILGKTTSNSVLAVLVGLFVTALIQSSGATSVMCAGFVDSGIMELSSALFAMLGANIGTTVTAQIVAFKITTIAPLILFIGMVLYLFVKNRFVKKIGAIILGFGLLFVGIYIMSDAVAAMPQLTELVKAFLERFNNPILCLLFGMVFTALINLFYSDGEVLVKFWIFRITREGIVQAAFLVLRIMMLVTGTFLLTYTTSPIALTDGMESLLSPLKKLHFPVHELSMMMSIALRFIPTLIEETDKIISAQKARGADFESGNIIQRVKNMVPLLVPLFISAFRRATDLAMAMESRCYRGDVGRTQMNVLRFQRSDWLALGVLVLFVLGIIGLRWLPGLFTLIGRGFGVTL